MKNIIQIVILVLIGTPIFAERHSPEFSAEIMGNGKLLHVTDYGLLHAIWWRNSCLHFCSF